MSVTNAAQGLDLPVEGAADATRAVVEDMGVDLMVALTCRRPNFAGMTRDTLRRSAAARLADALPRKQPRETRRKGATLLGQGTPDGTAARYMPKRRVDEIAGSAWTWTQSE